MPGGGGIGGRTSCRVHFNLTNKKGQPTNTKLELIDEDAKGSGGHEVVTVEFEFPKPVTLQNNKIKVDLNNGEEVKINWH